MENIVLKIHKYNLLFDGIAKERRGIRLPCEREFEYSYLVFYEDINRYDDYIELSVKNMYFNKIRPNHINNIKMKTKNVGEYCIVYGIGYDYDDKLCIKIPKEEVISNKKIPNTKKTLFKNISSCKEVYEIIYTDLKEFKEYYIVSIESIETKEFKKKYLFDSRDVGKKCMLVKLGG